MKLVPKLSLFFMAAVTSLLAAAAAVRVERDSELIETDMRHDHRVAGHVLRASVAQVWQIEGKDSALRVVAAANADGTLRARWLDAASTERILGAPETAELITGAEVQKESREQLTSLFAVRPGDATWGVLEVSESYEERDRYVRVDVRNAIISVILLALICGVLAVTLSRWVVGVPMNRLVSKAKRTGLGDLSSPLDVRGTDELSVLAGEMNAMCDNLAAARERAARETEAKMHAVEQLRHADRLATVGTLAAGLAHELGTPLSVVAGHAEMISRGEVTGSAVEDSGRTIETQVNRIIRIVGQLLDFARRKRPTGTSADPLEVARQVAQLLEPMTLRVGVKVASEGVGPRARIGAEPLEQILTNLMVNAMFAMQGREGGELYVRARLDDAAPPGSTTRTRFVRIDVTDTGVGIASDVLPKVFEPFFTTKAPGEGTGLGLSVVYGIALDHDGFVQATSEAGQGSTFSVFLPPADDGEA